MFQAFMNHIFQDMTDIFVVIYLDDILIFSDSLEDHQVHVRHVLEHLCKYDLHSKPEKCLFHMQKIEFLGFMVTPTGISMDTAKTDVSAPDNATISSSPGVSWASPTSIADSLWGSLTYHPPDCLTHKAPFTLGPDTPRCLAVSIEMPVG